MIIPDDAFILLRRFQDPQLTGSDLAAIRHDVLGLTQDELAQYWGRTRGFVGREETKALADPRTSDLYRGALMRMFILPKLIRAAQSVAPTAEV